MKLATIAVWHEMPIAFMLLLFSAYVAKMEGSTLLPGEEAYYRNLTYDNYEDRMVQNHFAPRFEPNETRVMEFPPAGSSITLRCAAEGNPTPNITWYKNNFPIRNIQFDPFDKWSIILKKLDKTKNGRYACVVCNQLGCISRMTVILVQEPYPSKPFIKNYFPGNVTAVVDDTVTFSCPHIDSDFFLYWIRPYNFSVNDVEVESTDIRISGGTIIEVENPFGESEQLTIYNVTKKDEGWYVCVAVDMLHSISGRRFIFLTVLESPPIQNAEPDNGKNTLMIFILTIVFGAMFLIAAIIVVIICKRLKNEKKQKQQAIKIAQAVIVTHWIKKVTVEKPQINTLPDATGEALLKPVVKIENQKVSRVQNNTNEATVMSEYELPEDIDWEVPRETLVFGKVLGQGEFGKVVRAECGGLLKPGMQSVVAVKMLKDGHSDAEMMALVSEMEIMKMIGKHENIINLLGCCSQGGPLYVIVEYTPNGNLREFLRNHRPENGHESLKEKKMLTEKELVWFSYQVARGMEYLASRRCVHCDLAARNVLVSRDCILKIADFGLAKDVQSKGYYRKLTEGKLPARWMALESLSDIIFNTQTDVWSFGVLLWEIMTLGATPYPKVPGQFLYQYLKAGHRMKKPHCCSPEIYLLMRECWSFAPSDRPTFTKLAEDLDKILTETANQE